MFFYDCEKGYVPDNGHNDVTDGTVENYDFDWDEPETPEDGQEPDDECTEDIV